jgi:hypothetical protein
MAGRKRPSSERNRLETRARALRAQGLTAIEISRAVGVPASTLARWAAETGWRQEDLAAQAEAAREVGAAGEDADGASARGPDARGGRGAEDGSEAFPPDALADDAETLTPDETARRALRRALSLAEAGQMAAAERMARLAERMARLAEHPALKTDGPAPDDPAVRPAEGAAAEQPQAEPVYVQRELCSRLSRAIVEAAAEGRLPQSGARAADFKGSPLEVIALGLVPHDAAPFHAGMALASREDMISIGLLPPDFVQADEPEWARACYESGDTRLSWSIEAARIARRFDPGPAPPSGSRD